MIKARSSVKISRVPIIVYECFMLFLYYVMFVMLRFKLTTITIIVSPY